MTSRGTYVTELFSCFDCELSTATESGRLKVLGTIVQIRVGIQQSRNLAWQHSTRGWEVRFGGKWLGLLRVVHLNRINMAWNVFKFCTGLKVVGSVMILVVLAVVGVSYYAVVISNYAPEVVKGGSGAVIALLVLILFHALVLSLFALSGSPLVPFSSHLQHLLREPS